ncbi:MAG: MqnA/MqnD/SBP family protein [Candidatus Pelethousia sp.]|nr:MqnA/MqnD/SBP family protein [Candidatus Pelethousia sp.]
MKKLFAILVTLLLALNAAACAPAGQPAVSPEPEAVSQPTEEAASPTPVETAAPVQAGPLNIAALKGPTGMGMVALMGQEYASQYAITLASSPDEVTAAFIAGSLDIAAVPINLAAVLYNKLEGEAVMLAVNTLGVLYILENGDSIQSIADLSGKTLGATGQGSTPEYVLNYLLEKNGIVDAKVEYYSEHSELGTLLAAGDVKLGMLPEPNVTATMAQNADLRVALDLTEAWSQVSDTKLVQGCIIARKSSLEGREADIAKFLKDYAASTAFVNAHHKKASMLIEQYGIMAKAALAQQAISKSNIVCITGEEMRAAASGMLQVLFEANPKSVGGALPGDAFYYGA